MELRFLRQEARDAIQKTIGENINRYKEEKEDWTDAFFLENGIAVPIISSGITVPDVELETGEGASQDIENAIRLHTSFKDALKPIQAADRRLWVALTHTVYYPYMMNRWPVDGELNEKGTNGTVTDRYFSSRGLFRNGISRLYWLAELTYDESLDNDPYEYTRFLMSYQDLINQVDGRSLCRNKNILRACLKTLKEAEALTEHQKRMFFEGLCKRGGVKVLDALPAEILDDMCKDTLDKIMAMKEIINGSTVYLQEVDSGKNIIIEVRKGKAFIGKTMFKSKPENLYRLTVGKEMELGKIKYRIINIE